VLSTMLSAKVSSGEGEEEGVTDLLSLCSQELSAVLTGKTEAQGFATVASSCSIFLPDHTGRARRKQ